MTGYPLEKDAIQLVLGLKEPWSVTQVSFSDTEKRLDIYIDFQRGAKFPCPSCGTELCDVHDTIDKEWRHLDFFQYPSYLYNVMFKWLVILILSNFDQYFEKHMMFIQND